MNHKKIVDAFIQRTYQSHPAEFYLSQWQKDGKCGAEFFDKSIYKLASSICKNMTEAEQAAFFISTPRTAEFSRMKEVLFRHCGDYDLTKASLMYHLYMHVKRQSLAE